MKRINLLFSLALAVLALLPGCGKEEELMDNKTFDSFILGLYQEGDAQYTVEKRTRTSRRILSRPRRPTRTRRTTPLCGSMPGSRK